VSATVTVPDESVNVSVLLSGGAVQNRIQLGFGATGTVTLNTVANHISGSATSLAADILLYDTAESTTLRPVKVTNNILSYSQLPIGLETLGDDGTNLGDGVAVTGNKISGAIGDAIDVCTNGNMIASNTIFNSGRSGVHFDASCGAAFGGSTGASNTATKNIILESGCAGILDDTGGAGSNTATPDTLLCSAVYNHLVHRFVSRHYLGELASQG
jgi:hypothetical protein